MNNNYARGSEGEGGEEKELDLVEITKGVSSSCLTFLELLHLSGLYPTGSTPLLKRTTEREKGPHRDRIIFLPLKAAAALHWAVQTHSGPDFTDAGRKYHPLLYYVVGYVIRSPHERPQCSVPDDAVSK